MYENKKQRLAPLHIFYKRVWRNFLLASAVLAISLLIGIVGYKFTVPDFDWNDSLLNASMILSGMGPVIAADIVHTKTVKVFASVYALFSGVTFLSTFGILIAPVIHRFFHKLHIDDVDN